MTAAGVLLFLWAAIQLIIGFNLVMPLLLYLAHLFVPGKRKQKVTDKATAPDYAVIVTAYQQTGLVPAAVNSILQSTYPHFLVYVVADDCDISDLHFDDERVIVLRPETVLAGNIRSHFYAISLFKRNHDIITIIDSDNLVKPDYLHELNLQFAEGYKAVQGIRLPKDLETTYSALDAARDIYYHFYDGKLLFQLGSSATLAGSGMAFTVPLYRECLEHSGMSGAGFDKVLQAAIVSKNLRIAFREEAVVYDEKTSQTDQLVKQRARWINTWFRFFGYGFNLLFKGIRNFSWNQFLFGIVLLRPPLFIFILLSGLFMIADLWINPLWSLCWLGAFGCFVAGFLLSLIHSNTDKRIYRSLAGIPLFMFYQVLSLLKIRKANRYSVATKHKVK
jgi:cellulose synthase/poly-beta-1,6-N-acetylglucosamine synthase-like glycosyltransferase